MEESKGQMNGRRGNDEWFGEKQRNRRRKKVQAKKRKREK